MIRVVMLVGLLISVPVTGPAWGQAFFAMDRGATTGRFIEPPRTTTQQLRVAAESIEQRRYGEAVTMLGDLLQRDRTLGDDESSGQDFFMIEADQNGLLAFHATQTLLGEARRLLSTMPLEGIEQYELVYGAQARKQLDEALANRNWGEVAEVKRRFFHSTAGLEASQLLLHRAIFQGSVLHAKRLTDQVLQHPRLTESQRATLQENSQWFAAHLAARDTKPVSVSSLGPSSDSNAADNSPELNAAQGTAKNDAANKQAATVAYRPRRSEPDSDFRYFGNQSYQSSSANGQMPLPDPLYTVVTTGSDRQERALRDTVTSLTGTGELPPPSWLPLRVGNHILMKTTERLVGVDVETGKRVWQYPWFETNEKVETTENEFESMPDEEAGLSLLKQRVWNDLPYGRLSSDGKRVYMLGDLAQVQVAMFSPLMGMQGTRPADTGQNSLIALDLATEGKLVWQKGGDAPADELLAGAFFLGPPLPIDDALYIMAELSGDVVLLCLDAETGSLRWRQQLLAIETGTVDNDPVRRVAGASAAYRDGVLICSTGAGAVIAVDLLDRSLLWGHTIERNDAINQNVLGRREGFIPDQLLKRWWDSTPLITGFQVAVTLIEADRLFVFDLLTGNKLWKEIGRGQFGSRYLAGHYDDGLLLVGSDNLRLVDLKTGRSRWHTRGDWLDSAEQISGLGAFGSLPDPQTGKATPVYFLPTSSNRILAVSLTDGALVAKQSVNFPLGNLVVANGQVVSQSATLLSVAEGQVSLEPKVAAALAANPNNVVMLNRKAQLLMEKGQREEALELLEQARALEPEDLEVQQLTISAMFGALKEDFVKNRKLLQTLDQLIDQPAARAELLKLQIKAELEIKSPLEAIEKLVELSTLVVTEQTLASVEATPETEGGREVSLDAWINARVRDCLTLASAEQKSQISQRVDQHLTKFVSSATRPIERMVSQFGSVSGSSALATELIQRYANDQQWLQMERMLLAAAFTTPDNLQQLSPFQALALAYAYAGGGLKLDAAAALEVALKDQAAAETAAKELKISLPELIAKSAGSGFVVPWEGELAVRLPTQSANERILSSRRISTAENRRVAGKSFEGWHLVSEEHSPVALRDPYGVVHPIPVDGRNRQEVSRRQVSISGGLMLALLPGELVAVNLFEVFEGQADPVLWRRPWRSEGGSNGFGALSRSNFGDQTYYYTMKSGGSNDAAAELLLGPIVGDTFYLLQGTELLAINAVTRETKWRNLDAPQGGAIVCDGKTVAVVSPTSKVIARFDCGDGKKLSTSEFQDYRLWSSSDQYALIYRDLPMDDLPRAKCELVLLDPINDEVKLTHTFDQFADGNQVFGRIVNGSYVVTLSNRGENLIWDLEQGKVVSKEQVEAISNLSGLHVLPRHDSMVILPAVIDAPDDSGAVAATTVSSDEHVRVDVAVWAIELASGQIAWNHSLQNESWGCTLTQSPVSPLVMLSQSKSRYLSTGSKTRSLDLLAIDTRNGKTKRESEIPVPSLVNDLATRQTLQPQQQRVIVNVGSTPIDYSFKKPEAEAATE